MQKLVRLSPFVSVLSRSVGFIPKSSPFPPAAASPRPYSALVGLRKLEQLYSQRLTFCVEGNIGAGKSTFLERMAAIDELRDLVEIFHEPPDCIDELEAFYAEPGRYAYDDQTDVFVSRVMDRVMQERESSAGFKPLRLMEGSVFTDRMVLVRALHEAKNMNAMEVSIYDSWFDPVVSRFPGVIPDAFIYLRVTPDTCHKRMKLCITDKGRASPKLEYLRGLHEKLESWLFPSINKPVLVDNSVHPDIRDRVFYLEANHVHHSIYKVPILVLDFEPDINFNIDIEAKREYGRQLAEFFEFVKKKKEAASNTNPARL